MLRHSTGNASCSDLANSRSSRLVGPSNETSPLLTTRSGRVASMYSLTRWKFSVSFGWLRARCGSEIWVRRNSGIERPFDAIIHAHSLATMSFREVRSSNQNSDHAVADREGVVRRTAHGFI